MKAYAVLLACGLAASTAGCASDGDNRSEMMGKSRGAAVSAVGQTYRGIGQAATAPLRDLNIMRDDIPVVLLAAMDAPYQTRTAFDCPSIAAEVAALDLALGPDIDVPSEERSRDYYRIGAEEAADAALDAVRDAAEGVVPVRSWVRRLSGARQNEKRVKEAIYAGSVRRAFLKGVGDHRGCAHPASPLPARYERARSASDTGQAAAALAPRS